MPIGNLAHRDVESLPVELTPVLNDRHALGWQQVLQIGWIAMTYLLISHLPLPVTTVWHHAAIGRNIAEYGILSASRNAATPLSEGMQQGTDSWLGDWLLYQWLQWPGAGWLSSAAAMVICGTLALWSWLAWRETGRTSVSLLTTILLSVVWSFGLDRIHPALLGQLVHAFFCLILYRHLISPGTGDTAPSRLNQRLILRGTAMILMVLWSNLDSSFLIGLLLVGCHVMGEVLEALQNRRRIVEIFISPRIQSQLLFAQLLTVATLVNPAGKEAWSRILQGRATLLESSGPLQLASIPGLVLALLVAMQFAVWKRSDRQVRPGEVLHFVAMVMLTSFNASLVLWLAPTTVLLAMRHLGRSMGPDEADGSPLPVAGAASPYHPFKFAGTLVAGLLVWVSFAFSPLSIPILGGTPRSSRQYLSSQIPIEVGEFLQTLGTPNSDWSLVWAPADWSDWFLFVDTTGKRYFVDSAHGSFPAAVQRDYRRIFRGEEDWERVADRYRVETIVVDKQRQTRLAAEVARTVRWEIAYEDDRSLVVQRKEPV